MPIAVNYTCLGAHISSAGYPAMKDGAPEKKTGNGRFGVATLRGKKRKQEHRLTARETEVLHLIVDGRSAKEIASRLKVSANTVEVHRANMMSTIGVRKTAQLVAYAIQNGLTPRPSSIKSG